MNSIKNEKTEAHENFCFYAPWAHDTYTWGLVGFVVSGK